MPQTVSSTKFDNPTYPRKIPAGVNIEPFSEVIATTSLNEIGDIVRVLPLPPGVEIVKIEVQHSVDLDTGSALDMDLVLIDDDGTTILYNAATAFGGTAGLVSVLVPLGTKVVRSDGDAGPGQDGVAALALKVNAAATTPVSGTVYGLCYYQNAP